jgi:hypothetical protein
VPFEEWETVYRERLQVERDLLTGRAGTVGGRHSDTGLPREARKAGLAGWAIGLASTTLLAIDILMLLLRRRRPRRD